MVVLSEEDKLLVKEINIIKRKFPPLKNKINMIECKFASGDIHEYRLLDNVIVVDDRKQIVAPMPLFDD